MSTRTLRTKSVVALLAAAGIALTGCSSDETTATGSTPTTPPASTPMTSEAPSTSPSTDAMGAEPFGAGCAGVPADGAGSFAGMAQDPVATAASNNEALSTLVTAVKAAGLVDTLNSAEDITVFAPTNDAFAAMDPATLKKALGDPKGLLTKVLTYHVVGGKLTPETLAGTHKTLNGGTVTVKGSGEAFTVDGTSKVVCGNVQTSNATVYIIDKVLMPKS